MTSPTGFLVRCSDQTSPLFVVEKRTQNGSTDQSTPTSVLCNEAPAHQKPLFFIFDRVRDGIVGINCDVVCAIVTLITL